MFVIPDLEMRYISFIIKNACVYKNNDKFCIQMLRCGVVDSLDTLAHHVEVLSPAVQLPWPNRSLVAGCRRCAANVSLFCSLSKIASASAAVACCA